MLCFWWTLKVLRILRFEESSRFQIPFFCAAMRMRSERRTHSTQQLPVPVCAVKPGTGTVPVRESKPQPKDEPSHPPHPRLYLALRTLHLVSSSRSHNAEAHYFVSWISGLKRQSSPPTPQVTTQIIVYEFVDC